MKPLYFILLLSIPLACSTASSPVKPQFNDSYFTGLETDVFTGYEDSKLDYDLTARDGSNIHFESCTQVEQLKEIDIAESEYHLYTMLTLNCVALKLFSTAQPATSSFLDELLIHKNIRGLPATAYPYVNENDKKERTGKTLSQYQSKLEFKTLEDGTIEVVTETDTLLYQIISTSDFTGDGIQDAIIRIDWHVIDAFSKGSMLIMISRLNENAEFVEINYKIKRVDEN